MTERARINRPITADEVAVIQAALERASAAPEYLALSSKLSHLRAVDKCQCGCDSVDFEREDPEQRSKPIADAIGTTPAGGTVGILVWGRMDAVTGLEVYDLGAGDNDIKLPTVESIRRFHEGAA
jgi:hypothetical protein